jgi:hypothetical protein
LCGGKLLAESSGFDFAQPTVRFLKRTICSLSEAEGKTKLNNDSNIFAYICDEAPLYAEHTAQNIISTADRLKLFPLSALTTLSLSRQTLLLTNPAFPH